MFILRNATMDDLNDLYDLSKKVLFINLPADKKIITDKIKKSLKSFTSPGTNFSKNYYIFVIEDITEKKIIGVSMVHAQHGTEHEPHFFLRVGNENKYSSTINTGFVHGTLKLGLDMNGPSEIGGLVVNPLYRGNPAKLGKQISFVRFLYMGLNPEQFKETILSELMPPFDAQNRAPLWEAIGRKFMNMEYNEADVLSRSNKEFILSLFPSDNIYMTLLPFEARNAVGKVGNDTLPVKKMLEGIGFQYTHEVDPFDGGPHYRCKLKDISLVKNLFVKSLQEDKTLNFEENSQTVIIQIPSKNYDFCAVTTKVIIQDNSIFLPPELMQRFQLTCGVSISGIPFQ